jgi:hypothetical protein
MKSKAKYSWLQCFIAPDSYSGAMISAIIDEAIKKEGDEAVVLRGARFFSVLF